MMLRHQRVGWAVAVVGVGLIAAALLVVDRSTGPVVQPVPVVNRGSLPAPVATPPGNNDRPDPAVAPAGARWTQGRPAPDGLTLALPSLGVSAAVQPVTAPGNVMQIPADPRVLGWWQDGAAPDDRTGDVVVVGHVNYAGVTGALERLPALHPGDTVALTATAGFRRTYRVTAIRTYAKATGIPAAVFSRDGPHQLVLITCGGPFDAQTGNYEDNIVAYATPT